MLRPGVVGMRGSTVVRLRPCVIMSTPPSQAIAGLRSFEYITEQLHRFNAWGRWLIVVFAENSGGLAFFVVCFLYKINPKPTKKYLLWEKVAQMPLSAYFFLGVGWPWVGEFVGFIIILICFPAQHNLINSKHPSPTLMVYIIQSG